MHRVRISCYIFTPTFNSGVESHDTERRRQIALKALSERLHKSTTGDGKQAAGGASQVEI